MDNLVKILMAAIAALVIIAGAATAVTFMNDDSNALDDSIDSAADDTSDVKTATIENDESDSSDDGSDIVSEEVKFNHQNGEGYYREVTYKDGGFRQFDVDTNELIGSSYDSDQDKLPSME